jgi:hypothetical protein
MRRGFRSLHGHGAQEPDPRPLHCHQLTNLRVHHRSTEAASRGSPGVASRRYSMVRFEPSVRPTGRDRSMRWTMPAATAQARVRFQTKKGSGQQALASARPPLGGPNRGVHELSPALPTDRPLSRMRARFRAQDGGPGILA